MRESECVTNGHVGEGSVKTIVLSTMVLTVLSRD